MYTLYMHTYVWPWPTLRLITGLARNIFTVYIRYVWQGNYQTYGHIGCVYTVLANPSVTYSVCYCMYGGLNTKSTSTVCIH